MSWYKQSAMAGYLQIGQKPEKGKPVFLWWWDGSFHVQQTEDVNFGHVQAIPNYPDVICRGRYDPQTNIVSLMAMKGIPQEVVAAIKTQWPGGKIMVFRQ